MPPQQGTVQIAFEPCGDGRVARVVLDRARKLNTLDTATMQRLVAALDSLHDTPDLRAAVLQTAGDRAFIGGADITEMARLEPGTARTFITHVHQCCDAVRRLPVPVIARIQGYCFGAGLELAAACDLRIASDAATFAMPEVRLGIPSVVEAALLPGLIGWGRTRRLLHLGETIGAAEAERWGLVDRVTPPPTLDDAVAEWLEALAMATPRATRLQKRLIQDWEQLPLDQAIAAGIDSFESAWTTDEPRRAMAAFLANRAARRP